MGVHVSRHILAHATKPKAYFVVGYDRPLQAFYLQIWDGEDEVYPEYSDDCFEIDFLPSIGAIVPEGLREILIKECLGEIDPNYVKDHRKETNTEGEAHE